jgi:hypothetical protein
VTAGALAPGAERALLTAINRLQPPTGRRQRGLRALSGTGVESGSRRLGTRFWQGAVAL